MQVETVDCRRTVEKYRWGGSKGMAGWSDACEQGPRGSISRIFGIPRLGTICTDHQLDALSSNLVNLLDASLSPITGIRISLGRCAEHQSTFARFD